MFTHATAPLWSGAQPRRNALVQCILEEAGGSVTDLERNTIFYNKHVLLNSGFVARAHS
jgi:3'-phosphoadenosine 5'-phosphosulfate (PAPS) 3'-phosphatase